MLLHIKLTVPLVSIFWNFVHAHYTYGLHIAWTSATTHAWSQTSMGTEKFPITTRSKTNTILLHGASHRHLVYHQVLKYDVVIRTLL